MNFKYLTGCCAYVILSGFQFFFRIFVTDPIFDRFPGPFPDTESCIICFCSGILQDFSVFPSLHGSSNALFYFIFLRPSLVAKRKEMHATTKFAVKLGWMAGILTTDVGQLSTPKVLTNVCNATKIP